MGKIYLQMKRETGEKRFGNTLRGKWNFCRGCNGCYWGKRIIRSNARLGSATRDTAFLADGSRQRANDNRSSGKHHRRNAHKEGSLSKRAKEILKQSRLVRRQRFNTLGQDQDHADGYDKGDDDDDDNGDDEDHDVKDDDEDDEDDDDDDEDDDDEQEDGTSLMGLTDVDQESEKEGDKGGNDPRQALMFPFKCF